MSTFLQAKTKRLSGATNPWKRTQIIGRFLQHYNHIKFPPDPSDKVVRVEERHKGRIDLLSYDLYGREDYWWIIVNMNLDSIKDPIFDIRPGLLLRVPTLERIQKTGI
jgi:hypothetical protein